ncbi:Retrovirus-related Pol polyprotein from transposon 17.6, partial [Mucuna pruriens]
MVALFHDMMHKELEVYMDDMIAKSRTLEKHIKDLWKLFARLCKFRLRLNPAKCTFGVKVGKLLGFVVNEKGIEVDPNKVKAIRERPAPRTESKIRDSSLYIETHGYLRSHPQTSEEESEEGMESRMLECLRRNQEILGEASSPSPSGFRKALNTISNSVGRVNGMRVGATGCHEKERASHVLSQQEIHGL